MLKKLLSAGVLLSLVVTVLVGAGAITASAQDLCATVDALAVAGIIAPDQVAAAKAAAGCGVTMMPSSSFTFTRDLTIGATGADVTALQNFLLSNGNTIPAGATGYFGTQTRDALAAYQAAKGITPAVGYFGPVTRASVNANTVVVAPTTPVVVAPTTPVVVAPVLGGEASLDKFEIDSVSDSDIEEGSDEAEVAELAVEFKDGDAMISRLDVSISKSGVDSWDVLESVSLIVDGDVIAEVDASDKDDYYDEDAGTLRFSGLDLEVMEDEEVEIMIAVNLQKNIDSTDLGTYNVSVDSMRWIDADGVTETETSFDEIGDTVDFDIVEAGDDDEVRVRTSTSDIDATTIELKDDAKSAWETIFVFDIDTEDSTNDITFNTIPVTIDVTGDSFGDIVSDLQLVVGSQTFDDWSYATGTAASTTVVVEFDIDEELEIGAGDREKVSLQVEFKALATEGATIKGSITSGNAEAIDAEGVEDIDSLSGSAVGDAHTLRTSGAVLAFVSATESNKLNTSDISTDDTGSFVLKFKVTAFNEDLYVNKTAGTGTTMGTLGVNYEVTNGSGVVTAVGTTTQSLSSNATTEGTQYVVYEGETKEFTLTVSVDPTATGFYGVRLYGLNYRVSAGNPNATQLALPVEDYETDALEVLN